MIKARHLEVDDELWERFKVICIKRDKKMRLVIITLITEWIREREEQKDINDLWR